MIRVARRKPKLNEAVKAARSLHHQLNELAETQRWVHHVADLNNGKILTFPLDRPITPISRAERLSRLGHLIDDSIFGGPSYKLTPKAPYQKSPEAWLSAGYPDYYWAEYDAVVWRPPQDLGLQPVPRGMHFYFSVSPEWRSVVSISLSGQAWPGMTGHVRLDHTWGIAPSVQIPITDTFAAHTIDLTFVPPQPLPRSEFDLWLLAGVKTLIFSSISFGKQPPLLSADTI